MERDNINPNYYKVNLANGGSAENIDFIQGVCDNFGSFCQGNVLKYALRANRKHDNPCEDIKKIIRYCEFWLNDINGKRASEEGEN